MTTNPATEQPAAAATRHRYRDQIDLPNGARIWPTYWAKSFPDSPEMIHSWNVEHPLTGLIENVATKERAELIVRSVNQSAAFDALYDAAFFARNRLLQDNYSDAETINKLNRALAQVEELRKQETPA